MFAGVSLFATVIISRPSRVLCSGAISTDLEIGHLCVHNQVFVACTGREGSGPQGFVAWSPKRLHSVCSLSLN